MRGAVALAAAEILRVDAHDVAGPAAALQRVDNDDLREAAHEFEQAQPGYLALGDLDLVRQGRLTQTARDTQPHAVVGEDGVAHAQDEHGQPT